jgi:hypothetical protein
MTTVSAERGTESSNASWLSRVAITVFLLFALTLGGFIAGVGFHDPDTCWLLALGRWIVQHTALPSVDPFSYTHVLTGRPFVLYQWLSEVLFYSVQNIVGLTGLLVFCAILLCTSFILLPLWIHSMRRMPMGASFGLIVLAVLSAGFHFLVRPEIFSYLFVSLWLTIIAITETNEHLSTLNKILLFAVLPQTMLVWCNMHTGFTIGLGILLVYLLAKILQRQWSIVKWYALALSLSLIATFINPWGQGLWSYLPGLFFAPFNKYILELRPLSFTDATYYPFIILAFVSLFVAARNWKRLQSKPFYILLPVIGTVLGVMYSRLIPFSALFMLFSIPELWTSSKVSEPVPRDGAFFVTVLIALVSGVVLTAQLVPPQVPQNSPNIHVPNAAIEFLARNQPQGRLLNDPELGDVLLWRMQNPPKVFIDSRFDMYGAELISDYRTIANCRPGWQQLLEKYQIDWIFFPPEAPVARALSSGGSWRSLYADNEAVIMARRI